MYKSILVYHVDFFLSSYCLSKFGAIRTFFLARSKGVFFARCGTPIFFLR